MTHLSHTNVCRKSAFTLIELLVVVSIISLLIAILMPSLSKAREAARRVQCATQSRQIGMALLNYSVANKAWFPMVRNADAYVFVDNSVRSRAIAAYLGNDGSTISPSVAKTVICPNADSQFTSTYVQNNGNRMGTTYQILAARGERAGEADSYKEWVGTGSTGSWYGWIAASAPTYSPGGYNLSIGVGPIPRESILTQVSKAGPSDQPITADIQHRSNGFFTPSYNSTYITGTVRQNHDNGANISYLDGHTSWQDRSSSKRTLQYYTQQQNYIYY